MKKIFLLGSLFTIAISLMACSNQSGYNDERYNAQLYDNAGEWMHQDFLIENLTRGAFYNDDFLDDDSYPKNFTYLIKNKEEFDSVLAEYPTEVDFNKRMLCVFVFTCNYTRPYKIKNISEENQVIKIEVKSMKTSNNAIGDACIPWQRCLVVEMNKLDITSVEFIEN